MDKAVILKRLKSVLNLQTDKALAEFLGITKATLSGWYSRNSMDFDLVFEKCPQVSPLYLIYGEGSPMRTGSQSITQTIHGDLNGSNSNVINNSPTYTTQDIMLYNIPIIPYYCYSQPDLNVSEYITDNRGRIATMPSVRQFSAFDLYYIVNDDVLEPFSIRGDVLALQKMESFDRPMYSRLYVVGTATDGLVPAKVSNEDGERLRLQAMNPKYEDKGLIIDLSEVRTMYKVVGLLRTM